MKKILRKIIDILWLLRSAFAAIKIPIGSRRIGKWLKANKKNQDPYLHPYDKRVEKMYKISKNTVKGLNIKIKVIGKDNLLKGPMWIVANHTAQYDGMYVVAAIGEKVNMTVVAKKELENNRFIKGILAGVDAFFMDRSNPRDGVNVLNRAANYSKQNNRSVLIFPEGTRARDAKMIEIKGASFAFPQKYALPILPVTIAGTLETRRWWVPGRKTLYITIHKPIKAIEHMKIPREILAKRVQTEIQKGLDTYLKDMTPKQRELHEKLKLDGIKLGAKRDSQKAKKTANKK